MTQQDYPLVIPVPIRPDVIVRLVDIPHDLTKAEAERIARIVIAMAVPDGEGAER